MRDRAFVLIADLDQECGTALEKELSGYAHPSSQILLSLIIQSPAQLRQIRQNQRHQMGRPTCRFQTGPLEFAFGPSRHCRRQCRNQWRRLGLFQQQ